MLSNYVLGETCTHSNAGMLEKLLGTPSIYFHECLKTDYVGISMWLQKNSVEADLAIHNKISILLLHQVFLVCILQWRVFKKTIQVLSREKYYYHQAKIMELSFLHNLGFLPFTSNFQKRPPLVNMREQVIFKYAYRKAMHTSRSIQGWVFSFQRHKKVPQII